MKRSIDARLLHILTDLRWLAYRLFGVPTELRVPGMGLGEDGWPPHGTWYCAYLHDGASDLDVVKTKTAVHRRCELLKEGLVRRAAHGLARGHCASRLRLVACPLRWKQQSLGHVIAGPYAIGGIASADIRRMGAKAGFEDPNQLEWAAGQVPVLDRRTEADMIRWFKASLERLLEKYGPLQGGASWETVSGTNIEAYYMPVRLALDASVTLFDVFGWNFNGIPSPRPGLNRWAYWELCVVEKGELRVSAGGKMLRLGPDEACLVPPAGRLYFGRSRQEASGFQLMFAGQLGYFKDLAGRNLGLESGETSLLRRIVDRLIAGGWDSSRESEVRLVILQVLYGLKRTSRLKGDSIDDGKLQERMVDRARRHLNAHVDGWVSLPELASVCASNMYTLSHVFRKEMGISPMRYHARLKMERARKLLCGDRLSIVEVASRLGYADPAPFYRAFRRAVGVTPATYARRRA